MQWKKIHIGSNRSFGKTWFLTLGKGHAMLYPAIQSQWFHICNSAWLQCSYFCYVYTCRLDFQDIVNYACYIVKNKLLEWYMVYIWTATAKMKELQCYAYWFTLYFRSDLSLTLHTNFFLKRGGGGRGGGCEVNLYKLHLIYCN